MPSPSGFTHPESTRRLRSCSGSSSHPQVHLPQSLGRKCAKSPSTLPLQAKPSCHPSSHTHTQIFVTAKRSFTRNLPQHRAGPATLPFLYTCSSESLQALAVSLPSTCQHLSTPFLLRFSATFSAKVHRFYFCSYKEPLKEKNHKLAQTRAAKNLRFSVGWLHSATRYMDPGRLFLCCPTDNATPTSDPHASSIPASCSQESCTTSQNVTK